MQLLTQVLKTHTRKRERGTRQFLGWGIPVNHFGKKSRKLFSMPFEKNFEPPHDMLEPSDNLVLVDSIFKCGFPNVSSLQDTYDVFKYGVRLHAQSFANRRCILLCQMCQDVSTDVHRNKADILSVLKSDKKRHDSKSQFGSLGDIPQK